MKTVVIFFMSMILSIIVLGQNETEQIYVKVDEVQVTPPNFTGVENASTLFDARKSSLIDNYLASNIVCPRQAAECCSEGTEIIQFTVSESGNVNDFKVINSVCKALDNEVIRVLKTTNGMWKPGMNDGEPVAMIKEVAFMFGNYSENTIAKHFVHSATRYFVGGNKNFLVKNRPEKAIHYYNKAINYLPHDEVLLSMRGLCHYALGDKESARQDWNRIVTHGESNALEIDGDITRMEGYPEMKEILAKHQEN